MFANKRFLLSGALLLALLAVAGEATALSCSVKADTWSSGYVATVTLTNDGSAGVNTWQVTLSFNQPPGVTGSWNASVSASANKVTASNASYNGNLGAGQSVEFGFQGTHNGSFQMPSCSAGNEPNPTPISTPTATPIATPTPVVTPTPIAPTATSTPTPTPGNGSNVLNVELESLAGQAGFSPFSVQNDSAASGGQFVVWPNNGTSQNNATATDNASGQMAISFSLSQGTSVSVQIAANMANGNDDSFYYRMDGGTWITQNNTATNGWQTLALGSYNLAAGSHSLSIQRREDGTKLDKVILTAAAGQISGSALPTSTPTATVTPTPTPTPTSGAAKLVLAINAGGENTTLDGVQYLADQLSSGGLISSTTDPIGGVAEYGLYQTERYGTYQYQIPVTNARYSVVLHFAEIYHTGSGERSFNLLIEGNKVLSDVDLYSLAGHDGAYSYTVENVAVTDGSLDIALESLIDNGTLSGFALYSANGGQFIQPTPTPTPKPTATPVPTSTPAAGVGGRWRVINTTDIGGDPDDEQSLVRQLVMANEYDIEGIITTTGCWKKSQSNTSVADKIINAYGQAYPNLSKHADGYPTPDYLKSISMLGQRGYGMGDVGSGKDSAGSNLIINAVDKNDPRPVWATCWGGCNTIAQALWKVKNTRSQTELDKFVSKLHVYDILGQDNAGTWIAKTFPNIVYIRATAVYGWQPSDSYLDQNIQNHGPLGAVYPDRKYATEGDTPAFMHLAHPALNDPSQVTQGGWGGRFGASKQAGIRGMSCMSGEDAQYDPYYMYGNVDGTGAISRWSAGYNNDFQARMDWAIQSSYSAANHHPVVVINNNADEAVMYLNAAAGSSVTLNAGGSSDPDGNSLTYSWAFYKEPSSFSGTVSISNASSSNASVQIPANASGKNIHIILTLRDNGSPNLYAYRRVVINVN